MKMTRPSSLSIVTIATLLFSVSISPIALSSHFEGFDAEEDDIIDDTQTDPNSFHLTNLPLTHSTTPSDPIPSLLDLSNPDPPPTETDPPSKSSTPSTTTASGFDYWDEDEFEGLPLEKQSHVTTNPAAAEDRTGRERNPDPVQSDAGLSLERETEKKKKNNFLVEIVCGSFLVVFIINYFTGKRENENIALAWAAKFATKESIFEKNFSLLGVGEGDDSPLLLKEGQNVFKFYASGRRYCQGLLATMELKSRHDLITRLYNMVVPCKDEITFEVYMNDDAMDHIVFALARKKLAKSMHKEERDLQRFSTIMSQPAVGRKWVSDELGVVSEAKEVAGDLITEAVLDQVFGEKAFEKYGKGFISMYFSDQQHGTHKKVLLFKFALPDAKNMADMTRLVALVPYYIDLIGRYKLSAQARSKTEVARTKAAQEAYKELQSARQEALQKKKAERKKMMEEAEAKLSAAAIQKKEAKERARQMRKAMPKMKMTRA